MTQASQLLKWSSEAHRCQDDCRHWVSIFRYHKRLDVVLIFLCQRPVSRLCVAFHLCPHFLSQYYNRRHQRRAKLRAGRLHEATLLLTQYCVAVLGLGPFILGLKGYRTGPGYLSTVALGRLGHWAAVKAQLAHCSCREGNTWHQLQLTTAGLKSSATEGPTVCGFVFQLHGCNRLFVWKEGHQWSSHLQN